MTRRQIQINYVQDAPTEIVGQVFKLKPGNVIRLPGGEPPRHRKWIRIYNEDGNSDVHLVAGDEQGVDPTTVSISIERIKAGQVIQLETSGKLYLKNISGSELVQNLKVMEAYYR